MLVLVDEYSRMSWVYFMAQKSELLKILPEWKHQTELESGERLVKVRSDGALELKKAINMIGSIHESTTADTPEQNAKVERMNRTIVTKARSMLAGPGLPKRLWAEAMATACYLRNITPSVDSTKSPYEIWTGYRPNVGHLKVFGCVAYVHIDSRKRDKLEQNAKKGIFVGYRRTTKQYRILNPKTGTIIESSHVIFKENQKGGLYIESTDGSKICHPSENVPDEVFDQEEQTEAEENQEQRIFNVLTDFSPGSPVIEATRDQQGQISQEEMTQLDAEVANPSKARPQRVKRPPNRLIEEIEREANLRKHAAMALIAIVSDSDIIPQSYSEAMRYGEWRDAIAVSLDSLMENDTWKIVEKPEKANLVSTKWVFKIKKLANGQVDKYKA